MLDISTKPFAYRPTQAAQVCGSTRTRIFQAIKDGKLQAHKDGRATIIFDDELRRWMRTFLTVGRKPDAA